MNEIMLSSLPENPFIRPAFWGRNNELRTIYQRLNSASLQCCAIIGEKFTGKTTLLQYLANSEAFNDEKQQMDHSFTFVYLDCKLTIDLNMGEYASIQLWKGLYYATKAKLLADDKIEIIEPSTSADSKLLSDAAYQIKSALEGLICRQSHPVIFVLDNFEVIARLPARDSEWLRALVLNNCAYVVASRHLLYLLYQYNNRKTWADPSPLINLFSDPIYLGLMTEFEVETFLKEASQRARDLGSVWSAQDSKFIRNFCGRHAELIRIGCKNLFIYRLQTDETTATASDKEALEHSFLQISISDESNVICTQLWRGLADSELSDVPRVEGSVKEHDSKILSPHQQGLIEIANGHTPSDKILFVLARRGLIEQVDRAWCVFSEVMYQFVLNQEKSNANSEETMKQTSQVDTSTSSLLSFTKRINAGIARREAASFTYMEGKVYDYLKSHIGEVCDREDIKRAVWQNNPPTNTALQKIIERIRDKIEPGVDNPSYLIAIRGQGYMLRELPTLTP